MNRRTVLKNLALVIGGAVLLPACVGNDGTSYVQLKHVNIDEEGQRLIADMAETIIPKTTTPGAKDLNLPAFVLLMIDDCYDKKNQHVFTVGMENFAIQIKREHGKDYGDLDTKTRESILTAIEKDIVDESGPRQHNLKERDPNHRNAFYQAVKNYTVFGYTNSQYFMTKEIVYELVPGRYIVHYPVSKLKLKTA